MNTIFVWTFREEESQLKEEISVKELFLQKEKEIFVLRYNITRITSVYLYLSLLNTYTLTSVGTVSILLTLHNP